MNGNVLTETNVFKCLLHSKICLWIQIILRHQSLFLLCFDYRDRAIFFYFFFGILLIPLLCWCFDSDDCDKWIALTGSVAAICL